MLKRHPLSEQGRLVAGVDEVGRGSVAGPVVAACVILNPGFSSPLLKDSKKLSENKRIEASKLIMENSVFFRIAQIEAYRIDEINILNATMEAMNKCVIGQPMDLLLVDGNQWRNQYNGIPYELVVKGDNTYQEIAAASIIAKTYGYTNARTLFRISGLWLGVKCGIFFCRSYSRSTETRNYSTTQKIFSEEIYTIIWST